MIIPSIDIMDGKAVQLRQGKEMVLEREDVFGLAREFSKYGEIAVIDLDAALGKGDNSELIKQLCRIAECRVGGGIRTVEKADEMLSAGARKLIIGTKATPEFLGRLPRSRVIAAIDTWDQKVVDKGWTRKTGRTPLELIRQLEGCCSEFLFTDVNREGMMKGIDFNLVSEIRAATRNQMTIAGGITTLDEIRKIEDIGANSQIGMAVYTGKINPAEAFCSLVKFNPLVPTIVQDRQVLMLAYSSMESLMKTFETGNATYYSRSRKKLWTKGETSGNFQELVNVKYDCDRDTLLFTVRQRNGACHTGKYSCFGDRIFDLHELYAVAVDRLRNPTESYTSRLLQSEGQIKEKILEEASEVVNYSDRDNLIWEIADLQYFLLALMAKKGVTLSDVETELRRRRK
ncbi:MAG: phosphoribosyl-AMP cyclohydrolase [archaeon]